ncbi:MAG: TetR/AcrR family transcriptional regulator [Solirubrobacteraceae bacterium]
MPTDDGAPPAGSRVGARERVYTLQRARLLDAMSQVVAERGLRGASVKLVTGRAGISSSSFRAVFASLDDCFLDVLKQVMTRSTALMVEAFEREPVWQDGVLAALEALLVFLDTEPASARVCLVESLAGPPSALLLRASMLEQLDPLVDRGRDLLSADQQPSAMTAGATIASVAGILHAQLVAGSAPPFVSLLGELAGMVVAPYLGVVAARREIERGNLRAGELLQQPSPGPSRDRVSIPKEVRHARADRLRLCLAYIAENPGVSNQAIASGIDLSHLGQTSTALSRLNRVGLLRKQAGGAGLPNAWWLTPHGEQVVSALEYP